MPKEKRYLESLPFVKLGASAGSFAPFRLAYVLLGTISAPEHEFMKEEIYDCEIRKIVTEPVTGKRVPGWVVVTVEEALRLNDPIRRCKACHGRIRLHRAGPGGVPRAHAEHMRRNPGCPLGFCYCGTFSMASDSDRVEIKS